MPGEANKQPYVDYEYYKSIGGEVSEKEFNKSIVWATALIDTVTFQRISRLDTIPDCVKNAVCSAIDKHALYLRTQDMAVRSESNDGWSVTYSDTKLADLKKDVISDIMIHLSGTGLTYRGRSHKYDCKSNYDTPE